MLSLYSSLQKWLIRKSHQPASATQSLHTTRRRSIVFVSAILIAVAGVVFILLAKKPATTGVRNWQGLTDSNAFSSGLDKTPQPDVKTFITQVRKQHGASTTTAGAYTTVQLSNHTIYRLHHPTTHQEVATTDTSIRQQIARQLTVAGIEYEVVQNNSDEVVLEKGEWVISWGGLLYLPELNRY